MLLLCTTVPRINETRRNLIASHAPFVLCTVYGIITFLLFHSELDSCTNAVVSAVRPTQVPLTFPTTAVTAKRSQQNVHHSSRLVNGSMVGM